VAALLDSTFAGRRALVTGHTGFKGSWLAAWLTALGAEVVGLALDPADDQPLLGALGLSCQLRADYRIDIRNGDRVADIVGREAPEFIFHLAAQPLVRHSYAAPVETFEVNVQGVVNVLEAVRKSAGACTVVVATTDKCYENRGWLHAYREEDPLGGHDPYSSSKACAELVIASYRKSFFAEGQRVKLASARAGNVIGGGDWARDRIVPDCIRALRRGEPISVRNKHATRPWQHVLEPLGGYLMLAAAMDQPSRLDHQRNATGLPAVRSVYPARAARQAQSAAHSSGNRNVPSRRSSAEFCTAVNFGPQLSSNRTVGELVNELLKHFDGRWEDRTDPTAPHEASLLNLAIDKAHHLLGWQPVWGFAETVERTAQWYQADASGDDVARLTFDQIRDYQTAARAAAIPWAKAA
jgi:CDP-glucose 4,6-dehydratase